MSSSRGIERRCVEDVAYRVIASQQAPEHATIARFRVRHDEALADLFTEVLSLCKEAGLVKVGLIAIDGTKVHANASHHANLDYEQLAREILKEAARIDAAEDELYGEKRGDELPEHLRTSEGPSGAHPRGPPGYGAPRIHADLRLAHGIRVSRERVERLMRAAGISGLVRRKRGRTTIRVPGVRVADDLVERQFRPGAPNVLWIAT